MKRQIVKMQFQSKKAVRRAISEMPGLTSVQLGTALIIESTEAKHNDLSANAMANHGGHTEKLSEDGSDLNAINEVSNAN